MSLNSCTCEIEHRTKKITRQNIVIQVHADSIEEGSARSNFNINSHQKTQSVTAKNYNFLPVHIRCNILRPNEKEIYWKFNYAFFIHDEDTKSYDWYLEIIVVHLPFVLYI